MNRNISDAEVSSCYEVEEMCRQAERAAIDAVAHRMSEVVNAAVREGQEIVGERNVLSLELENEMRSLNTVSELLATAQQQTFDRIMEMMNLQTQLTNVNEEAVNLLVSLQELREQNQATLRADPIYNLIQEERVLQDKLEEMGIYVYPSTGSECSDQPC